MPIPLLHETSRLKILYQYGILDTPDEADFDDLTKLAAQICQTPVALITFVDDNRQWFKSKFGVSLTESPLNSGFCPFVVQKGDELIIPDTLVNKKFAKNPVVVLPPHVRFYAGMPLITKEGYTLGTICVLDFIPRKLTQLQIQTLQTLSRQIVRLLERKRNESVLLALTQREQQKAEQLEQAMKELTRTQMQLIQNEKMIGLGQLVAGVAHEINNPLNFIYANLIHANQYTQDLLSLVELYQNYYPHPVKEIEATLKAIDFDFIQEDLPKLISSMTIGADRIRQIVLLLRNFSHLEKAEMAEADIHEGLDNTLLLLKHRLKGSSRNPSIKVIKEYGDLPVVQCYAGQLNQVFMNILTNAIDALEESLVKCHLSFIGDEEQRTKDKEQITTPTIHIHTEAINNEIVIRIADNGPGISLEVQSKLFDPFFTTKPVGSGTGLGLSISYQIIERHGGQLTCKSAPGKGAEFVIKIPMNYE
ncbi:GAF domain-containing protein [Scytonema sp. UIC 10036]|uniref:ATP-binding protein n=1 Tax=Scytonema sp. UIC 10036 TaxID=2304196 RepID=UPI0012DA5FF8|nr:ATP-binding protein [Scytonema sp. UIC 10036]MUG97497.1 GAF domain-containing protein [Scytonema sp. UIC 10036]